MFELKRSGRLQEKLKVGNEILEIDLDIDSVSTRFRAKQIELLDAQQALKGLTGDDYDKALATFGGALVAIMELTLGEDNTQKVLQFYEGKYVEMCSEVVPYIQQVIVPKLQQRLKELKRQSRKRYM